MSKLVQPSGLEVNPFAQSLHQQGLDFEGRGQYSEAHASFQQAITTVLESEIETADAEFQLGHIERDDSFTTLREAIKSNDLITLDLARRGLMRSIRRTASLLGGEQVGQEKHLRSKKARRAAFSQHSMTLGLLARQSSVRQFVFRETTMDDEAFGLAHDYARSGNNGYGRVSNAMNGARHERAQGSLTKVAPWIGRAAYGLSWTLLRDRGNAINAGRTFARLGWQIRTRGSALRSIKNRP